jgi:hypothetical protein
MGRSLDRAYLGPWNVRLVKSKPSSFKFRTQNRRLTDGRKKKRRWRSFSTQFAFELGTTDAPSGSRAACHHTRRSHQSPKAFFGSAVSSSPLPVGSPRAVMHGPTCKIRVSERKGGCPATRWRRLVDVRRTRRFLVREAKKCKANPARGAPPSPTLRVPPCPTSQFWRAPTVEAAFPDRCFGLLGEAGAVHGGSLPYLQSQHSIGRCRQLLVN